MAAVNTNEAFGGYLTVRAIRKWIERVRVTKFSRDRVAKYNQLKNEIYTRTAQPAGLLGERTSHPSWRAFVFLLALLGCSALLE